MKTLSKITFLILFFFIDFYCIYAQENENSFGRQIFLPSLEIGYIINNAEMLSGGLLVKTSIEYRYKNNNDLFLRLNYDNSDANYKMQTDNFSNVLEGKARFSDLLLGFGYRFGDRKVRFFLLAQAGLKFYNFPTLEQNNNNFSLRDVSRDLWMSRITLGAEYYFDEKSAFTLEILQSSIWENKDFWQDKTGSWGIAVGFITSLF